jgi:hypothetical protein
MTAQSTCRQGTLLNLDRSVLDRTVDPSDDRSGSAHRARPCTRSWFGGPIAPAARLSRSIEGGWFAAGQPVRWFI